MKAALWCAFSSGFSLMAAFSCAVDGHAWWTLSNTLLAAMNGALAGLNYTYDRGQKTEAKS